MGLRDQITTRFRASGIDVAVVAGPVDLETAPTTARVYVLIGALPAGRLPPSPGPDDRTLADEEEHDVRSIVADVLTNTRLTLQATVARLVTSSTPASVVVVVPATGPAGRASDGVTGIAAAGVASMVRTLSRELAANAISINGVRAQVGASADGIVDAAIGLAHATERHGSTITGQILDVGAWENAPTIGRTSTAAPSARTAPRTTMGTTSSDGPPGRFAGRVALVTGAVRPPHMGRATALRLAAEGADVVVVDAPPSGDPGADSDATQAGALEALVSDIQDLGRRALAVPISNFGARQADHLVQVIVDQFGQLDVCCHVGGGTGPRLGTGPLLDVSDEAWAACLEANLFTPWFVAAAAVRQMRTQPDGGSIVLLTSYAVRDWPANFGSFVAARTGVLRLVEVLAQQCAADGVRINTVLPLGVAPTGAPNPGLADLVRQQGTDQAGWARGRIPAGRLQDADETAAVFAFLASDDASFVSGQAVATSGGAVD